MFNLRKKSPDFLIIGAQKSATSSLHDLLLSHPDISAPIGKEMHFFDKDYFHEGDLKLYWSKFQKLKTSLTFETTPSYLYCQFSAPRIFKTLGDIPLIVILRNPVERALSAYKFYRSFQDNKDFAHRILSDLPNFNDLVNFGIENYRWLNWNNDKRGIITRGLYSRQLLVYQHYFSKVYILEFEDLKNKPLESINGILEFLKIEKLDKLVTSHKNKTILNHFDEDFNQGLEKLEEFYMKFNHELKEEFDFVFKK
jgi:hypothetical protein